MLQHRVVSGWTCRALAKGNSNAMKAAGLKLAAAVVEGLPQTDRNMAAVQAEAWKLFERQLKVSRCLSLASLLPAHDPPTRGCSGECLGSFAGKLTV